MCVLIGMRKIIVGRALAFEGGNGFKNHNGLAVGVRFLKRPTIHCFTLDHQMTWKMMMQRSVAFLT